MNHRRTPTERAAINAANATFAAFVAVTLAAIAMFALTVAADIYGFSTRTAESAFYGLIAVAILAPFVAAAGTRAALAPARNRD